MAAATALTTWVTDLVVVLSFYLRPLPPRPTVRQEPASVLRA